MMQFTVEGNPIRTNADVQSLLNKIRQDPRTSNPRVLGINMLAQQQAKSGGYPKFMFHASLDPVQVFNEIEEEQLLTHGYQPRYLPRAFPKVMYRRNLDAKFAPKHDPYDMTADPKLRRLAVDVHPFVEERVVRDENTANALLDAPAARNCSKWVVSFDELPPLQDGPEEDPAVTIARLQGQIAAQEKALTAKAK